jgi:hypothetical protein
MAVPKTIRTGNLGKHELRLVQSGNQVIGMVDRKPSVSGEVPGVVWQTLLDTLGQADPRYVGLDGARRRFEGVFPDGFASDGFDAQHRDDKLKAKSLLEAEAPLDRALHETGLAEAVAKAFAATNLLAAMEKPKVRALLRGPDADRFIHAAARFAHEGDTISLAKLAEVLKPHSCARWTVATYLPFLWAPDRHMVLKADAASAVAAQIGHPFALVYAAPLKFDVYAALMDMVAQLRTGLADMDPRDGIDIQGFIAVAGTARVAEAAPVDPAATDPSDTPDDTPPA